MSTMFNEIPSEILLRIIDLIPNPGQIDCLRRLRLVSRRLNAIIVPVLFSHMSFSPTREPRSECRDAITSALKAGETTVFDNVRNAEVVLFPMHGPRREQAPWLILLDVLIPAMRNLYSLQWDYLPHKSYTPNQIIRFVKSVGSIKTLKELSFTIGNYPVPGFSLEPLSNLNVLEVIWKHLQLPKAAFISDISRLIGRCPGLESFTFKIPRPFCPDGAMTLKEMLSSLSSLPIDVCLKLKRLKACAITVTPEDFRTHIRHFRHLDTLKIKRSPSPSAASQLGEICAILQNEQIFLKNIAIDAIYPPSIFNYLLSCSAIERLHLLPRHPRDDSARLVNKFFTVVLPHHEHSLRSLKVGGNIATQWSKVLSNEQLKGVEECQHLQRICCYMSVMLADMATKNSQLLVTWLELATRLSRLQIFECAPITLKRSEVLGSLEVYEPVDHDPDPDVRRFVVGMAKQFEEAHHIKFEISFGRYH